MIKYQLKNNGGKNNNDCLLIAIGRLAQPGLDEKQAVAKGWQAVFDGINTMKADDLKAFYTELKNAYVNDIPNVNNYFSLDFDKDKSIKDFETRLTNTFDVSDLSPEIVQAHLNDRVKQEVKGFLDHLKQQKNLQKYVELLKAIPEDKKQNLMLVSKNDLEFHPGQVYEKFKDFILAGQVPHFLVHNGAHYSNIIPTHIDYNAYDEASDPESLIKQAFVNLMNDALAEAASFTSPQILEQMNKGNFNVQYTLDMLNNDLQFEQDMRQAKAESNRLSTKTESNQLRVSQSSVVKNPNPNINWDSVEQQVNQALTDHENNQKLTQLLEFIDKNIDPAYQNNSRYTYKLSYAGETYNVPWSLMQAYDSRTFGSYDHAKILAGLKEDLGKDDAAQVIAQKLRAPMYGTVWNNTRGVTEKYLETLANSTELSKVIMTEKNDNEFNLFNRENYNPSNQTNLRK